MSNAVIGRIRSVFGPLRLLVARLPELLLLGVSLFDLLRLSLPHISHVLLPLDILFLLVHTAKLCQPLDHGVDLFLLVIHEHLLERSLRGQIQIL